jgi:dTDP-glucose 4,6-dehydratase
LFITNAIEDKQLPVYGDGMNVRDWIFVLDHCDAIDYILYHGTDGEVYNIGGNNERNNLEITHKILQGLGKSVDLIAHVKDRPGHDRRYSLDCSKVANLGWQPKYQFDQAMDLTIDWYKNNRRWWSKIKSGEYLEYYKKYYGMEG